MADEKGLSDEDRALFRARAGGVRPLRGRDARVTHARHARRTSPRPTHASPQPARDAFPEPPPAGHGGAGDVQHFARPGVQQKLLRRLRRGQIPAEAEVDLHGMTVREAHRALLDFLAGSHAAGRRCVRVIHGKGRSSRDGHAVLKWQVDAWLKGEPRVLAFCSAPPVNGGTGALHLLLRR